MPADDVGGLGLLHKQAGAPDHQIGTEHLARRVDKYRMPDQLVKRRQHTIGIGSQYGEFLCVVGKLGLGSLEILQHLAGLRCIQHIDREDESVVPISVDDRR